jgi:ABC-type nickel/cobalt efflux system permease component RcnA
MATELTFGILTLAFLLGIKHSVDADHVVAVSGMLIRSTSVKKTATLSISWALGHMLTASIITVLLFTFKEVFLEQLLSNFEIIVAIMLILIAVLTYLWEFNIITWGKHSHGHAHDDGSIHYPHEDKKMEESHVHEDGSMHEAHHDHENTAATDIDHGHVSVLTFKGEHKAISGIGIIHGLASNDELLLLTTLTLGLDSVFQMLFGVAIFTVGVVIGMVLYGTILKVPIAKFSHEKVTRVINLTLATLTLIYAFYIIFGGETINLLPFIS